MSLIVKRPATDVMFLASGIVSAYVANNPLSRPDLPRFILSVHAALSGLCRPTAWKPQRRAPIVPVRKTVTPDYIISLEDGKPYKSLRGHLRSRGLTPEQYRRKWDLPGDYPMAAPNYSKHRSELARQLGLGMGRRGKTGPRTRVANKPF